MKKLLKRLKPPGNWQLPVIVLMGIFTGLGVYIFIVSNAASYLSDDPETCINCHVMNPQYASWQHSSHREVANCNDCHVPHNNVFNKYFFKAKDGLRHSSMFTLRLEPQVIQIKEAGRKVVHQNCIRCHGKLLEDPQLQAAGNFDHYLQRTERECWDCHRETPHGRVNSLSATPYARVPSLGNPVPEWLQKFLENNTTTNTENNGK
jgi:cytochrome c nitrite reductase small subunit